ncbi:MAG: hypothetical protein AAGG11_23620, partial [Pseudomonadota bacterium]
MTVEVFDPDGGAKGQTGLTATDVARLLEAAHQLEAEDFGLSELEIARLGPQVRSSAYDWSKLVSETEQSVVESLIRLLTLAEQRFPAWESGAESPVIPLARALKQQEAYPTGLTGWIR